MSLSKWFWLDWMYVQTTLKSHCVIVRLYSVILFIWDWAGCGQDPAEEVLQGVGGPV